MKRFQWLAKQNSYGIFAKILIVNILIGISCNVFYEFSSDSSLQSAPQLADRVAKVNFSCFLTVCLEFISLSLINSRFSLTKTLRFSPDKQFLFHHNLPLKTTKKKNCSDLFICASFLFYVYTSSSSFWFTKFIFMIYVIKFLPLLYYKQDDNCLDFKLQQSLSYNLGKLWLKQQKILKAKSNRVSSNKKLTFTWLGLTTMDGKIEVEFNDVHHCLSITFSRSFLILCWLVNITI